MKEVTKKKIRFIKNYKSSNLEEFLKVFLSKSVDADL